MSLFFRTFFFLIFLVSSFRSFTQHPYYYAINENQGLPSNEVYELVQDSFGYIWIGCDAGLYRYDGFEFVNYRNANQKSFAISTLKIDSKQNLFCRNFSGQLFKVSADTLQLIYAFSKHGPTSNKYVLDSNDRIWFVEENFIKSIDENGRELFSLQIPLDKNIFYLADAYFHNNLFYISSLDGHVIIFDTQKLKITYIHKPENKELNEFKMFFKRNDQVYILSRGTSSKSFKIYRANQDKDPKTHYLKTRLPFLRINGFAETKSGNLWFCTSEGIAEYNENAEYFEDSNYYLNGQSISYIFTDREDITWASSLNEGIFVSPNIHVKYIEIKGNKLPASNFTAVKVINEGELYAGTHSGHIFYINLKTQDFQLLNSKFKSAAVRHFDSYKGDLFVSHGNISKIINKKIIESSPIFNARYFIILNDSIYFVTPETNGKISIKNLKYGNEFIKENPYSGGRYIHFEPISKTFYFSLSNGFYKVKNNSWEEIKIHNQSLFPNCIQSYRAYVFVPSLENGFYILKDGKLVLSVNEKNSIIKEPIKQIHITSKYIWAISRKYIYRINIRNQEIIKFNSLIGIPPQDINAVDSYKGQLYFATNRGIKYMPEDIKWHNTIKPHIKILNYQTREGTFKKAPKIDLSYSDSRLEINFSAISLKSKNTYKIAYRIAGLDSTWNYVNAGATKIHYPSIPSGNFTFEIKTIDDNQIESDTERIEISVETPIWLRWWFILLSGILFGLLIFLIFYFRAVRKSQKLAIQNRLISSNLLALRAQMNPHFLFNSINSIQALIIKLEVRKANFYMTTFSQLLRKILEASDEESIILSKELSIIKGYLELEKLRFGEDFNFDIRMEVDVDIDDYYIPSMMLQPFVENSLKHGLLHKRGDKNLEIYLSMEDVLVVNIKDNGVGRERSAMINTRQHNKPNSFATEAMKKRIQLLSEYHKMEFTIDTIDLYEDGIARGTHVKIKIPDIRFGN